VSETVQKPFARRATVVLLVLLAVWLRGYNLPSPTLWADEAESSLNALTIVAEGVPGDHYLGLPLYENTLLRPWPESAEYEFRDLSYSDRGLAVYHAWLPLYAIAAAFRLSGVSPEDAQRGTPPRDASQAEIDYWTMVPRLPAVAFGGLSVLVAWALARRVHSEPAGIALAFAVASSDFFVYAGRQARYYSAAVAGSTLCALAIWHAWHRGRLFDHALVGLAVGVLFHVHSVSAVAMAALYVAACPLGRHQPGVLLRVITAGGVGAVLVIPWAVWSGLITQSGRAPAALRSLDAQMVLASLPGNLAVWATLSVALLWLAAASRSGAPLSDWWRSPILDIRGGLYFALCWLTVSWLSFFVLMPAASFFPYRLNLMIAMPLMLASSLLVAAIGRAVRPTSVFLPAAGMAIILVSWSELPPRLPGPAASGTAPFIEMIRAWTPSPGGRVFASPGEHLVLTYYSGRPIQSIAPVRREWLDRFRHDLIILESSRYVPIAPATVQETARRQGRVLTAAEAQWRARDARMLATTLDLQASGVSVAPHPRALDALDDTLVEAVRDASRRSVAMSVRGTPFARDTTLLDWQQFRHAFYYWFSNPAARAGTGLNYARCRAEGDATVLPNGVVVLDCRATRPSPLVPAATASLEP
jgi:hypothetical protein